MNNTQGPVTMGVTLGGRSLLGRVFHVDIHRFALRASQAAADRVGDQSHVLARAAVRWLGLFARNLEMALYWGATWLLAHVLVVVVGGDILGHAHLAWPVLVAAEVLPGGMFVISLARLAVAMARVRQVDVFAGAPSPRALGPGGPPRGWLLLRLLQPTDIDVVAVLAVGLAVGAVLNR